MCNRDGERPPSLVAEGRGETPKRDAKYGAPCCRFRPAHSTAARTPLPRLQSKRSYSWPSASSRRWRGRSCDLSCHQRAARMAPATSGQPMNAGPRISSPALPVARKRQTTSGSSTSVAPIRPATTFRPARAAVFSSRSVRTASPTDRTDAGFSRSDRTERSWPDGVRSKLATETQGTGRCGSGFVLTPSGIRPSSVTKCPRADRDCGERRRSGALVRRRTRRGKTRRSGANDHRFAAEIAGDHS